MWTPTFVFSEQLLLTRAMATQGEAQESEPRMTDAASRDPSSMVPDSRSSSVASVQAEPLTLDEDELHDAKAAAEDVLKNNDPQTASEIFGLVRRELAQSTEEAAEVLSAKINELVEKADKVVEANKLSQEALARIPGTAAAEVARENPDILTSESEFPHQEKSVAGDHPHSD